MSPEQVLRAALRSYRSDNLERAKFSFRGMTPAQMQEQHGQSGNTRQEVLDGYQRGRDECDAASELLEGLLGRSRS